MSRDVRHSSANTTLTFQFNGAVHTAKLRCNNISFDLPVNAEESHARQTRAFYPHRRSQGNFALTFEFIHWGEYNDAMVWFRDYSTSVLSASKPSAMKVVMTSRKFNRVGVPTKGITFGDHTASMVFSPTISFISIADLNDPINKTTNPPPSHTSERQGQISTTWFYPDSQMSRPGAVQSYLFDQQQQAALAKNAEIDETIIGKRPATGIGAI